MTNQQKALYELKQAATFREIADRHEKTALKLLASETTIKTLPKEIESVIARRRARQKRA